MNREIKPTKKFSRQIKKRKRDSRWDPIFKGNLPSKIDGQKRSPWKFINDTLAADNKIPDYFYSHSLKGYNKKIKKNLKKLDGQSYDIDVKELHFDGYNGDHLLIYTIVKDYIYLLQIGTHSELYKK